MKITNSENQVLTNNVEKQELSTHEDQVLTKQEKQELTPHEEQVLSTRSKN